MVSQRKPSIVAMNRRFSRAYGTPLRSRSFPALKAPCDCQRPAGVRFFSIDNWQELIGNLVVRNVLARYIQRDTMLL
jgi:hypothetical protein